MVRLFDYLFEQAYERRFLANKLFDNMPQIVENMGLVCFAKISDNPEIKQILNHWTIELESQCEKFGNSIFKSNNAYKYRQKFFYKEIVEHGEFDSNKQRIQSIIKRKFELEKIPLTYVQEISDKIMNNMGNLVELLANYSDENFQKFVEQL